MTTASVEQLAAIRGKIVEATARCEDATTLGEQQTAVAEAADAIVAILRGPLPTCNWLTEQANTDPEPCGHPARWRLHWQGGKHDDLCNEHLTQVHLEGATRLECIGLEALK